MNFRFCRSCSVLSPSIFRNNQGTSIYLERQIMWRPLLGCKVPRTISSSSMLFFASCSISEWHVRNTRLYGTAAYLHHRSLLGPSPFKIAKAVTIASFSKQAFRLWIFTDKAQRSHPRMHTCGATCKWKFPTNIATAVGTFMRASCCPTQFLMPWPKGWNLFACMTP